MAVNDEETVALIAESTHGKATGAHKPGDCVGAEPAAAAIKEQGFGWENKCGKGHSEDTVTSEREGPGLRRQLNGQLSISIIF